MGNGVQRETTLAERPDPPRASRTKSAGKKAAPNPIPLIAGLVLLAIPLVFVVVVPGFFADAHVYLRLTAALGGAIVGALIPGALNLNCLVVRAFGALVAFVLVFAADPAAALYAHLHPPKDNAIDFNACETERIFHPSGGGRGTSSSDVADGVLSLKSDEKGLVQILKICPLKLSQPASEFEVHMGDATVSYSGEGALGAKGPGFGVLFSCGPRRAEKPTWDSWSKEQAEVKKVFEQGPQSSATLEIPDSSFPLRCPQATRELTALIVLSDPWDDAEIAVRLDGIEVTPR
jgi:hypothetical protein